MSGYGVTIDCPNYSGQTALVRFLEEDSGITHELGYETIPFTYFPSDGTPQGVFFLYFSGDDKTCVVDVVSPNPSVTPSITPTISVTPSITPSISVTPSITPSVTVSPSFSPSVSVTPSVTPSVSISATPSVTPSSSQPVTLCLYFQALEFPSLNLPVAGYENSRPYFEFTESICGLIYKIYFDGTQWVLYCVTDNYICSTMAYTGLYPDTNVASWVSTPPAPQPPFCTCEFLLGTLVTYPVPCSTPPPSPSPSQAANCCETYIFTTSANPYADPCEIGTTITYLDCNDVWQTILLPPQTTTTLCLRYGYPHFELNGPSDCRLDVVNLGNCDCS